MFFTSFSQGEPGYIWCIRIAINTNGAISYDSPWGYYLPPSLRSRFPPAVFRFNDSPYIVWIGPEGGPTGAPYISIAPIAINTNGIPISCDISKRSAFYEPSQHTPAVFDFNNAHYIGWIDDAAPPQISTSHHLKLTLMVQSRVIYLKDVYFMNKATSHLQYLNLIIRLM